MALKRNLKVGGGLDYSELLSELFRMRDQFHLWHFQTKGYASHKAMDSFYNSVLEFADLFIESGVSNGPVPTNLPSITLIDFEDINQVTYHLEDRCSYWLTQKDKMSSRPDLANEVDGFILSMKQMMYWLTLS